MIGLPLGWLCTPLGLSCTPLIMQHQTAKKSAPPMRQGCAFVSESPALFKISTELYNSVEISLVLKLNKTPGSTRGG